MNQTNQWKILGQDYSNPYWNYQAILKGSYKNKDIYLSPELMKAYSK